MSKTLSQILNRPCATDPVITGVTADSRKVREGFLFAALPGSKVDGRTFIPGAIESGATAVLAPDDVEGLSVPVVHAGDLRRAYALAAAQFWAEQPATCVAVTGTNGKTSVAGFCRQIYARLGRKSASMGTLGVVVGEAGKPDLQLTPPGLTTPDAADVAEMMARLASMGVTHLAVEASSHGIDQRRLDGVRLAAAGFTNFTQDHLDYHGTMGCYRAAKLRLFETLLPRASTAVLNADSDAFPAFASAAVTSGQSLLTVGHEGQGLKLVERTPVPEGQRLKIAAQGRAFEVLLPLAGDFQASNVLVAAGLCVATGEDLEAVIAALATLEGAAGRLQRVGTGARGGEAYVDYAHTPDGLETVLAALRPHTRGKLIVVFGAGGDRDRGKRPLMGEIAARLADVAIVTDDNPRSEEPASIRAAILAAAPGAKEYGDRREAIRAGAALLADGDVLVVAGKGHEQGQLVAGVNHPFDDVTETAQALEAAHA
ncbi:UDP-N-acetylmuramoyl-L-alanyl-D-glutamate--2,6-diaminopimelate ligase [Caulobacter rhizosphaerae]|uniref:UDP-N-acetylmuramoyl-L-alanyl-D-glutamate--2, 6-diaminopimelate ligase n=1 Tax=Caulobacter rhizosphaerae TaxID=2010972 RepID=UPI0013D599C1|nr:UDP-N-acetylmuramoyl-L-alanyl-D-glutamate--2,6-diaminopimelate ligase [Caulobacter rhizosphaerae]GGL45642.1 UDP-N-acetylmuramoyl-L-alanyl-D-glutamate--2,6-diaminopimelate ligase [Caulobacter rhizosphaerae]